MVPLECEAVIFDLDGVLTTTDRAHRQAWKETFDEFLRDYTTIHNQPFSEFDAGRDYDLHVDGRPRYEGVRAFLSSRDITLPFGEPSDAPGSSTICAVGNAKNERYCRSLKDTPPKVQRGAREAVRALKRAGLKVGVASASKNCRTILSLTGLDALFDVVIDGVVAQREGLQGKPDPDVFLLAAKRLKALPGTCAVVEDALAGVRAGVQGNFGFVVGIGEQDSLPGADVVLRGVRSLTPSRIRSWFSRGLRRDGWRIVFHGFDAEQEKRREALTAVGNGYLGTRGCHESQRAGSHHYPGCYVAGVFDDLTSVVHGKRVRMSDMVNAPDWLAVRCLREGQELDPFSEEIVSYRQELDLRGAVLVTELVSRDSRGRVTRWSSERFVSMRDPHLCALRCVVTPMNYDARLRLRAGVDAGVRNGNVARYSGFRADHLTGVKGFRRGGLLVVEARTKGSDVRYRYESSNTFRVGDREGHKRFFSEGSFFAEEASSRVSAGQPFVVEKLVHVSTSRDDPALGGDGAHASLAVGFARARAAHKRAWARLWDRMDVRVEGDRFTQRLLRLHAYHLLVTASPHNESIDAGMPARGLHGESYHGHVFWDELFILPFYMHHFPRVARALLRYRHRRLPAARQDAAAEGLRGAMFPWQSADSGHEETQPIHYNPRDGSWGPDRSRNQRHVSIAIFRNFYLYAQRVRDPSFLAESSEVMVAIARFWADKASYDRRDGKYHIRGVMGPDEFHEQYPRARRAGLDDNAYTNVLVSWLLEESVRLVRSLPRGLRSSLAVDEEELGRWGAVAGSLSVRRSEGVIEQFKGYFGLKELEWDAYRERYGDIQRLDRILKAEGRSPDSYKVSKQADVLMIFYVLGLTEAVGVLRRLGVRVRHPLSFLKRQYDYYIDRTSHGSTLSRFVHDAIISRFHYRRLSWEWFSEALKSDFLDTQGGTTAEGVHCGMMAGTLRTAREDIIGVSFTDEGLSLYPLLPHHWVSASLRVHDAGRWYDVRVTQREVSVRVRGGSAVVRVHGRPYRVRGGGRVRVVL